MDYRRLGSTGLTVSELCFGTWRFGRETNGVVETGREEAHELLDAAADHGINFIDTANVYGTETDTPTESMTEDEGVGFGVVLAAVAIVAGSLLLTRRD